MTKHVLVEDVVFEITVGGLVEGYGLEVEINGERQQRWVLNLSAQPPGATTDWKKASDQQWANAKTIDDFWAKAKVKIENDGWHYVKAKLAHLDIQGKTELPTDLYDKVPDPPKPPPQGQLSRTVAPIRFSTLRLANGVPAAGCWSQKTMRQFDVSIGC